MPGADYPHRSGNFPARTTDPAPALSTRRSPPGRPPSSRQCTPVSWLETPQLVVRAGAFSCPLRAPARGNRPLFWYSPIRSRSRERFGTYPFLIPSCPLFPSYPLLVFLSDSEGSAVRGTPASTAFARRKGAGPSIPTRAAPGPPLRTTKRRRSRAAIGAQTHQLRLSGSAGAAARVTRRGGLS